MSHKGITRWAGPHMLDEPCFDRGFTSVPRKKTAKQQIEADQAEQKKENHKQRMLKIKRNYRGSIEDVVFKRYEIVPNKEMKSDQEKQLKVVCKNEEKIIISNK